MKPILDIQNISKVYAINRHTDRYLSLRDSITKGIKSFGKRASKDDFWALQDVSLKINEGETVGIIGKNGAGKSTLLKIISQITPPTKGKIILRGRVASLLEVGTGFHPELTGRENIFLNGALLGLKKREINARLDEIIDFSDVEKFLETPLKHYSSGMQLRLAFAVAAHLEPEILVIDEVLAVGDAQFQKKCLNKMQEISKNAGRTVLFVSHNLAAVEQLCHRSILLENGQLNAEGPTNEIIGQYLKMSDQQESLQLAARKDRKGNGSLQFTNIEWLEADQPIATNSIQNLENVKLRLHFNRQQNKIQHARIDIGINNQLQQRLSLISSSKQNLPFQILKDQNYIDISFANLPLYPGHYYLDIYCELNHEIADWVENAARFSVVVNVGNPIIQAKNPGLFQPLYHFES